MAALLIDETTVGKAEREEGEPAGRNGAEGFRVGINQASVRKTSIEVCGGFSGVPKRFLATEATACAPDGFPQRLRKIDAFARFPSQNEMKPLPNQTNNLMKKASKEVAIVIQ